MLFAQKEYHVEIEYQHHRNIKQNLTNENQFYNDHIDKLFVVIWES